MVHSINFEKFDNYSLFGKIWQRTGRALTHKAGPDARGAPSDIASSVWVADMDFAADPLSGSATDVLTGIFSYTIYDNEDLKHAVTSVV